MTHNYDTVLHACTHARNQSCRHPHTHTQGIHATWELDNMTSGQNHFLIIHTICSSLSYVFHQQRFSFCPSDCVRCCSLPQRASETCSLWPRCCSDVLWHYCSVWKVRKMSENAIEKSAIWASSIFLIGWCKQIVLQRCWVLPTI